MSGLSDQAVDQTSQPSGFLGERGFLCKLMTILPCVRVADVCPYRLDLMCYCGDPLMNVQHVLMTTKCMPLTVTVCLFVMYPLILTVDDIWDIVYA